LVNSTTFAKFSGRLTCSENWTVTSPSYENFAILAEKYDGSDFIIGTGGRKIKGLGLTIS